MANNQKSSIIPKFLTLGFVSLLVLSACNTITGGDNSRFQSKEGVNLESFMPSDLMLLAKVGTNDEKQIEYLKNINSYFPVDLFKEFATGFNEGFTSSGDLSEYGLDYEKDVLPIIGEKSEFYVGISLGGQDVKEFNPDNIKMSALLTTQEPEKLSNLLNKFVSEGKLKEANYNNNKYLVSTDDSSVYLAQLKDVLIYSNNESLLKTGFDNFAKGVSALKDNKNYNEIFNKYYKSSVAFVYGDSAGVMNFVQELAKQEGGSAISTGFEGVKSQLYVLAVEEDGIRFKVDMLGDNSTDFTKLTGNSKKIYLADKVPSLNTILYLEGGGLKAVLDQVLEAAKQEEGFDAEYAAMKEEVSSMGLDLEKDIFPLFENNFAFIFGDNNSVLPTLGLFMDVNGHNESAVKVASKMDEGMDFAFEMAKADSEDLVAFIEKEEVKQGKLWKYKLLLGPLLATAPEDIAKELTGLKVELYYGLVDDNTLGIALYPNLEIDFANSKLSVAQSGDFKNASNDLGGKLQSVTFVSFKQALVYVDRIMNIAKQAGAVPAIPPEYEMAKQYLDPIKYFIGGNTVVDKQYVHGEMFIKITNN